VPGPVSGAAALAEQLNTERTSLDDLRARYTEDHPDVIRTRRRIRDLERLLAGAPRPSAPDTTAAATVPNRAELDRQTRIQQLRADLETLDRQMASKQADERSLLATMADVRTHLEATPSRETELVALNRDYTTYSQLYASLLARKEESKGSGEAAKQPMNRQFKILDPARVPERPVSPKVLQVVAGGALAGLMLAIGLIGLLEYRNSSLRTEDDVAVCTGLPVIATIPLMSADAAGTAAPRLKRWFGPLSGPEALSSGSSRR
jgi:uncharacterized protein involved in exopolysaccharide biosynthesis